MKYIPGHTFTTKINKNDFTNGETYRVWQIHPLGKDGIKYIFTTQTGHPVEMIFPNTEQAEGFINKISGVK